MPTAWPHAPTHWTFDPGTYIITSGIYQKQPLINTPDKRDEILKMLFACAAEFGWHLQAWAVMLNHYHIVGRCDAPQKIPVFIKKLHANTARYLNKEDKTQGRKVWHQFWDTHITNEKSWLARLRYVHTNPVHHGVVAHAEEYRWCSAAWLARNAKPGFVKTLETFKTDMVSVPDDY